MEGIQVTEKITGGGAVAALTGNNDTIQSVNCFDCSHYFITHDPDRPHGCRTHGFKSRNMPAHEVRRSSGLACQVYLAKQKKKKDR